MARFFNTAGPIQPDIHYHIPPLDRVDLGELLGLVRDRKYFVLHAPRQTGKTTTLLALRDKLNADGHFHCVYANFEVGQAAREDTAQAMRAMLSELRRRAQIALGDGILDRAVPGALEQAGPDSALNEVLYRWCSASEKPVVLLIDEIDALVGDTLLSALRQLRAGYDQRPQHFPQSIVLCGLRDVRDYRIHSSATDRLVLGGSAFNIKSESLRLGDFNEADLRALLAQHTAETGQDFAEEAVRLIWTRTAGQPWLVNALGKQLCFDSEAGRGGGGSRPVAAQDVVDAQEALILRHDTHIDDLANKLAEERVRRVVQPILAGAATQSWTTEDLDYACDLGLVAQDEAGRPRIANAIYAEVVPRHLSYKVQAGLPQEVAWYVGADGSLDVEALMREFQEFFRQHSEHWVQRFDQYQEAGPQLLLQAFLQRIVNGGGRVEREYALGRGRVDLLIVWPGGGGQRAAVECKIRHGGLEATIADGIAQTRGYMDRCGATAGHLVIFDRSTERLWEEKIFCRHDPPVTVWGM